jgi:hypothetical protein
MATISVANLMLEIKKAAVKKQSELLNKVKLMEAKQESDEPVREASKIKNRLNLGHCPNLPDLPPSPKTWDAYFNIFSSIL